MARNTAGAQAPGPTTPRNGPAEARETAMEALARTAIDPVERLMAGYLALCNRVITRSTDKLWYQQAKRLNRAPWGDASFRTIVYDEDPDNVLSEFELRADPEIPTLSFAPSSIGEPALTWKVPIDYLRDVVEERPEWYLEHPLMLDGVWFVDRLRDELRTRTEDEGGTLAAAAVGFAIGAAVASALILLLRRLVR